LIEHAFADENADKEEIKAVCSEVVERVSKLEKEGGIRLKFSKEEDWRRESWANYYRYCETGKDRVKRVNRMKSDRKWKGIRNF
jgi:hypothetical protein